MKVQRILAGVFLLLAAFTGPVFGEAIMIPQTEGYTSELVPLRKVAASISIQDQVVITEVDQKFDAFWGGGPLDVFYAYPVPELASVIGFGRWVDGEISYFPLVQEEQQEPGGNGGSHFEEIMEYLQPNPLFAPLYELPDEILNMRLEYAQLMEYDFGEYVFTYPLGTPFNAGSIDTVIVNIAIESQRTINGFIVENYNVEILHQDADSISLQFTDFTTLPNEDLTIRIMVDQEDTGMWVMSYCEHPDSMGHYLAVLEPGEVEPDNILQKYFTFVLDISGSMAGTKIQEARDAAIFCIEHLDEEDYFNIVTFEGQVACWMPDPVIASVENKAAAVSFLNSQTAGGGTNLNGAMMQALGQVMDTTAAIQVLLLSDGEPTSGITYLPSILDNIQEANVSDASIFTIGVGVSQANGSSPLDFLNMIAYENHGLSLFIDQTDPDIAGQIENFFTRFASPAVVDIHIGYGEVGVFDYYPPEPYAVFIGSQTLIAGRYEPGGMDYCTITGRVSGNTFEEVYGPFNFTEEAQEFPFVPRMWAMSKIDYWLAYMAVNGEDDEIVDMIVELSLRYGIVTPYTSYDTGGGDDGGGGDDNPVYRGLFLTATSKSDGIHLSWNEPSVTCAVSYVIYRSEDGGRTFARLNAVPLQATRYVDTEIVSGQDYVYRVEMIGHDGPPVYGETEVRSRGDMDTDAFSLYPNPFNAEAKLNFTLETSAAVRVDLFNVLGQQVATLANSTMGAGQHKLWIDANQYASGAYFLHMHVQPVGGQPVTRIQRLVITK